MIENGKGFRIVEAGLCSLIVDHGRRSSRSLGVAIGGAADVWSHSMANFLVGNEANTPAIECNLLGPTLLAERNIGCAVAGAPFVVSADGIRLPVGKSFNLQQGQTLRLSGCTSGMRTYLAVAGGFDAATLLGGKSSLMALRAGDGVTCASSHVPVRAVTLACLRGRVQELRFLPGTQSEWFDLRAFEAEEFTASEASNRMGIRLLGAPLSFSKREMASEPVCPGTVQVTPDGRCIILGVDGQTIGGYPKIAQVISADLDGVGQLRVGDPIRFREVTLREAAQLARDRARSLQEWELRLHTALPGFV